MLVYLTEMDGVGKRVIECAVCKWTRYTHWPIEKCHHRCTGESMEAVGTELHKLLDSLGMKPTASCGCAAKEAEMNRRGVQGCRDTRAEIVGWITDAYRATSWSDILHAGSTLMGEPWFSTLDPFGSIVDEAIRRAELLQ